MTGYRKPISHGSYPGWRQHERRGEKPPDGTCGCAEAARDYRRIMRNSPGRTRGDCDNCPKTDVIMHGHPGSDLNLCKQCYWRWQQNGFDPDGPGEPKRSARQIAEEHRETILTMSTTYAALEIGVRERTIERYRKLLREAS